MVLVKNWPFLHVFIFGNIAQENVFYDILAQKRLSKLWQQEIRKVEKMTFSKRVDPYF